MRFLLSRFDQPLASYDKPFHLYDGGLKIIDFTQDLSQMDQGDIILDTVHNQVRTKP